MPQHAFPGGLFRCVGCATATVECGHLAGPEARWGAITDAMADVMVLQALANAPGTGSTYAGALARFEKVITTNYDVARDTVFPTEPGAAVPLEYVESFLGFALNTIRTSAVVGIMSALRWWHVDRGVVSPTCHPMVKRAVKGLRRVHAGGALGTAMPKIALPVDVVRQLDVYLADLARDEMEAAEDAGGGTGGGRPRGASGVVRARGLLRDRAWILLSAAAALRKSEACALTRADVQVLGDGRVYVFIRKSKTDQEAHGRRVYVPHVTMNGVRVAEALLDHAWFLDEAGVPPEGALFGNWHNPTVFLGTPHTRQGAQPAAAAPASSLEAHARPSKPGDALVRQLKRHIKALADLGRVDLDAAMVAAHSLRRTAANEFRDACRAAGVPDTQIMAYLKDFCRWASDKSVGVYVMQHANAMVRILAGAPL